MLSLVNITCARSEEKSQSTAAVRVIKNNAGVWQLLVEGKPYFIKGMTFTPVKIGEDPKTGTARNWMFIDDNHDGVNDIAFQTWVDANRNNRKDDNEKTSVIFNY